MAAARSIFFAAAACAALAAAGAESAAAPPPAASAAARGDELRELMDHEDYARAEPIIRDALASLHGAQGLIFYKTDRLAEAVAEWETSLKLDSGNAEVKKLLDVARKELAAEKGRRREVCEHFIIQYEAGARADQIANLRAALAVVRRDACQRFLAWPAEKFTVILYSSDQYQYDLKRPSWSAADYDGKIRLRGSKILDSREELAALLTHEYAHALIFRTFGSRIPVWLNEGLAQNARPDAAPEPDALKQWNATDKKTLPAPWTLGRGFEATATGNQARAAYLESKFFVRWLLERYDIMVITRWGRELAAGKTIDQATATVFAMSADQLFSAWKESMETK